MGILNEHTINVPTLGYGYGLGGHFYGKREAAEEGAAPVVPAAYPFAGYGYGLGHLGYAGLGHLGYAGLPLAPAVVPATHEVTYKTYTPTIETNVAATNAAVPVAVGGYKAVAGDNGDLKGAVHEVPAIFGAPALNTQVNDASQGSLTVGTSAFLTSKITGYNAVPAVHYIGKREAEADPALLYSTYSYGNGYPYAAYTGSYGYPYGLSTHAGVYGYGYPYIG